MQLKFVVTVLGILMTANLFAIGAYAKTQAATDTKFPIMKEPYQGKCSSDMQLTNVNGRNLCLKCPDGYDYFSKRNKCIQCPRGGAYDEKADTCYK